MSNSRNPNYRPATDAGIASLFHIVHLCPRAAECGALAACWQQYTNACLQRLRAFPLFPVNPH